MKKIILLSLILLLTGCAIIDIYKQARWDNNEYNLVNQIQTRAELGIEQCSNKVNVMPYVDEIYVKSIELKNYTADIKLNAESITMSTELLEITKGLKEQYYSGKEVSQKYCELKFTTIYTSSNTIKRALQEKPR